MKTKNPVFLISTFLFLVGIISTLLSHRLPNMKTFVFVALAVTILYLFTGVWLFKGYYPDAHPLLRFLLGYLYAGVFIAFTLVSADWPLARMFLSFAPAWIIALFAIVIYQRNKVPKEGFYQFLIEGSVMLLLNIFLLLKM